MQKTPSLDLDGLSRNDNRIRRMKRQKGFSAGRHAEPLIRSRLQKIGDGQQQVGQDHQGHVQPLGRDQAGRVVMMFQGQE